MKVPALRRQGPSAWPAPSHILGSLGGCPPASFWLPGGIRSKLAVRHPSGSPGPLRGCPLASSQLSARLVAEWSSPCGSTLTTRGQLLRGASAPWCSVCIIATIHSVGDTYLHRFFGVSMYSCITETTFLLPLLMLQSWHLK